MERRLLLLPVRADAAPSGDGDPATRYLARLGPGSQRTMRSALDCLAATVSDGRADARRLPWHQLRAEHTQALRQALAERFSPATANKHLAALRGVLREAWELGSLSSEDYHQAIALPRVDGPKTRPRLAVEWGALERLVGECQRDPGPAGQRDAALLSLLLGAGLRRSEAVALDVADFDRATGRLHVPRPGRPARHLALEPGAAQALEAWLERRGAKPGPLFAPVNKGGRIEVRRLSEQAIYAICRRRARAAGLPPLSPDDLRLARRRPRSLATKHANP
ncbi:MAG: tyrosine-type recombinase/integrase [Proteobacteria bacterium]|nr:tyrosine-type recombinase/integrase [Pseudomonadota bacterium]